ncbi:MAG: conserved rane protein of unknown function [Frankiales bacterium]|nr:conserved rane protein of unknown function [Frankiales bacterium]
MIGLLKSEVLKIRSTQVWIWMLALAVALSTLFTIGASVDAVSDYRHGRDVDYYSLFTASTQVFFALMVLGVLGLTTEFRHKTITPTLLATPNRWQLLGGKAAAYGIFSIIYSIVCLVASFATAIIWLTATNVPLHFGDGVPGGVVKVFVTQVLFGIFGLGLGALIRNQAAAMVFSIVYLAVLNFLLAGIPWVRKFWMFEPGGAAQGFVSHGTITGLSDDTHLLNPTQSLGVLIFWCVLLLVLGGWLSLRRDIS